MEPNTKAADTAALKIEHGLGAQWDEARLLRYIVAGKAFKSKSVGVVEQEFALLDPMTLLRGEIDIYKDTAWSGRAHIGRIDVILKYRGIYYVCEIKYKSDKTDFWDAMKVLGYCEYFKWQTSQRRVRPAIIIPQERIRLEHKIIAGRLGITLIGAVKHPDNTYTCTFLDQ